MKRQTEIWSISGQLEECAALIMAKAGEVRVIHVWDFPPEVAKFDALGRPVKFAIIIGHQQKRRFENLVAELRA